MSDEYYFDRKRDIYDRRAEMLYRHTRALENKRSAALRNDLEGFIRAKEEEALTETALEMLSYSLEILEEEYDI